MISSSRIDEIKDLISEAHDRSYARAAHSYAHEFAGECERAMKELLHEVTFSTWESFAKTHRRSVEVYDKLSKAARKLDIADAESLCDDEVADLGTRYPAMTGRARGFSPDDYL